MIGEGNLTDEACVAQIHAVSQAAYTLEAERIGCANFPPLQESLADLRQNTDCFLVFRQDDGIVGVLSYARRSRPVVITRLVVSPTHLRQGIASSLLAHLEQQFPADAWLSVSTAEANSVAVLLYRRAGYLPTHVTTSPEGLSLVHFTKRITGAV
jgi:ribosomal protein S18 acetylase RimI-like enzyme